MSQDLVSRITEELDSLDGDQRQNNVRVTLLHSNHPIPRLLAEARDECIRLTSENERLKDSLSDMILRADAALNEQRGRFMPRWDGEPFSSYIARVQMAGRDEHGN